MKIKLWYLIRDYGDGSSGPSFFKTEAEAEAAGEEELASAGYRLCEDVGSFTFEVTNDGEVIL